jgi:hypothetical protein
LFGRGGYVCSCGPDDCAPAVYLIGTSQRECGVNIALRTAEGTDVDEPVTMVLVVVILLVLRGELN